jgi:transposase
MARSVSRKKVCDRRVYTEEFKAEAVQMILDGHSPESVAKNLGISSVSLLYRWKAKLLRQGGATAATLEGRVRELEDELRRVERERDILKKALAIFSRQMGP